MSKVVVEEDEKVVSEFSGPPEAGAAEGEQAANTIWIIVFWW